MSNKKSKISLLTLLFRTLIVIALVGLALTFGSFFLIGIDDGFKRSFCYSSECIKNLIDTYSNSFVIFKATLDVLAGIATAGGIVIAVMTYMNSASTSALTNHIAHFSIFQNYLNAEIAKRKLISPESVDVFAWYNYIFSTSRYGKTDVSESYIDFLKELNDLIVRSNKQSQYATPQSFRYKPHQERIQSHLKKIGVYMPFLPRNDFFEVEGCLFELIQNINCAFCYSYAVIHLEKRRYI